MLLYKNVYRYVFILVLSFIIFYGCKGNDPSAPFENNNEEILTGSIYAGGIFDIAGDTAVYNIAMWNGKKWRPVGDGITGEYTSVECFAVYNNELYAAGEMSKAGSVSVNNIARWNGKEWKAAGSGIDGKVNAMAVYNNELYAGGFFTTAGGALTNYIARWNGSSWSPVGEGLANQVLDLKVYNGSLYAAGSFNKEMEGGFNADYIARWDGSKWNMAVEDIFGSNPEGTYLFTLSIFNNELYAGGNFISVNNLTTNSIAKSNGSIWMGAGEGVFPYSIYESAVFKNKLYVAGDFLTVSSVASKYFAAWNGSEWIPQSILTDFPPYCMYATGSSLYIGGLIHKVNGEDMKSIFRWDGNKAHPLGKGINGTVRAIIEY